MAGDLNFTKEDFDLLMEGLEGIESARKFRMLSITGMMLGAFYKSPEEMKKMSDTEILDAKNKSEMILKEVYKDSGDQLELKVVTLKNKLLNIKKYFG